MKLDIETVREDAELHTRPLNMMFDIFAILAVFLPIWPISAGVWETDGLWTWLWVAGTCLGAVIWAVTQGESKRRMSQVVFVPVVAWPVGAWIVAQLWRIYGSLDYRYVTLSWTIMVAPSAIILVLTPMFRRLRLSELSKGAP